MVELTSNRHTSQSPQTGGCPIKHRYQWGNFAHADGESYAVAF
ncbi:MAG: hypothetical protein AAF892_18790 [Cyanobacteria bacterium P01_D01_bin.71]